MITGTKAFKGKSQASLIASILEHEPVPMSALQRMTPPSLDGLVQACLAKEPENRWQTAHDLKLQLKLIVQAGSQFAQPAAVASKRASRERLAWALCILAVAGLIALSLIYFRSAPGESTAAEFAIGPPDGAMFASGTGTDAPFPVISPDGRHIAFIALNDGGGRRIWVRSIDSAEARVLPGTEGAQFPFWSADSRNIAFFAGGKLSTVEFSGGPVQVLCDAPAAEGGPWNREGTILFAPNGGGAGLHRISSSGGQSTPITFPDKSHESYHRWPFFLPDGKHFLYFAPPNTIYVGSLD
jgi:hypothetical protein